MPPYDNFPSKKERENLMKQLKELEENGDALTSGEHYKNYVKSLRELNNTMDQYYTPDADGNVPSIEQDGKDKLMDSILKTATAGETFLASIANNGGNLNKGTAGLVGSVQAMMSQDYETISLYNPKTMEMSLPELQQDARTQVIDLRGVKIGKLGNAQSSRLPMTVVDEKGMKTSGVFTKASYVSVVKPFKEMIDEAAAKCPDPDTKKKLQDIIPRFRNYLQKNNKELPGGVKPENASDEMVVGKMIQMRMWESKKYDTAGILKRTGIDVSKLGSDTTEILLDGFQNCAREPAYWVNGLELGLKDGDRLDQRNTAMSAVANLLGISNLVARSTNMKFMDENGEVVEGTFMEKAKGFDLFGKGNESLFEQVNDDPLSPGTNLNKDIADLQVLDFICGNIDRHGGNLFYDVDEKTGQIKGVQAIDNDSAFGHFSSGKNGQNFRLNGTDYITVMSEDMAKKVSSISPEMLKFTLRGRGLSDDEIQAACGRLQEVKDAVKEPLTKPLTNSTAEVMTNKAANKLSIMTGEKMREVRPGAFSKQDPGHGKKNLFTFVNDNVNYALENAREKGYSYKPHKVNEKQFKEVSTTNRKFTAAGIGESLKGMSRMIRNEVTGFAVSGLSKFLRSSGAFRTMVSDVKNADKLSDEIKKEIGENGTLDRNDPKVKEQLEKADRAVEAVRKSTKAYLEKKMKEKNVTDLKDLRGKSEYEQKRIDYALKVMESVKEYEMIAHPENAEAKQVKEAVKNRLDIAAKRKAKQSGPGRTEVKEHQNKNDMKGPAKK